MKINKYIVGTVMVLGLGVSTLARADLNKFAQYREIVDATKGSSAMQSNAWTHMSKYSRELDERGGIGNTVLPSAPQNSEPKNFRNNY